MTRAPDAADAAALPAGTRLAEYEIRRVLGGGGFGITYLAHDTHLDLPVAIKEYFPGELLARGAQGRVAPRTSGQAPRQRFTAGLQRFVDEARALAAFRHPHIVRVLRYFRALGTAYIVMEYETGQPLKHWLQRQAPLSLPGLLAVVRPLLDGLEAVHAAGFLHRDIKPDNIYIRSDGRPVLLDFGAARRVLADGEMTNIVTPGFAPFEQYHSQGAQGPWTDIYALGAVMYWMVTGRKPVEAAARIQADAMPGASILADATVFGRAVLHAIDWALQPDEQRRPQSVAQLRAALEGGEASVPSSSGSTPASRPDIEALRRRNLLCTILFIDLVGYSARSVNEQAAAKRLLNDLIARALEPVPLHTRLAIDTGDGAALCFLGDPEEALHVALLLRDLLRQRPAAALPARLGLHLGPVRVVQDINQRINVIGDGINVAQRVMDFARPNELLLSRACHDVISRIAEGGPALFRPAGTRADKHGRQHELFAVTETVPPQPGDGLPATIPLASTGPGLAARLLREAGGGAPRARAAEDAADYPAAPRHAALQAVEQALCRDLGPVARLLVRQQLEAGASPQEMVEALARHIDVRQRREAFRLLALRALGAA